jgi:hypothetical protein
VLSRKPTLSARSLAAPAPAAQPDKAHNAHRRKDKTLPAAQALTFGIVEELGAKTAYAAFVAHATKMGELYSDLAKAACKPVELPFANLLGTKE